MGSQTAPALGDDGVDVWFVPLTSDRMAEIEAWSVLSAEERARADRLGQDRDRAIFVRTRARLRHVLAGYLAVDAVDVAIGAGPEGKPEVVESDNPGCPRFNVSHSGLVALIAVTARREVGVDVELVRTDVPWRQVAASFFSPAEVVAIERVPAASRRRAFFDCWVRREAYLKGLGTGLRRATGDFRVPLGDAGGLVADPFVAGAGGPAWYVHPLDVEPGYAAALAVDGDVRVTVRRPWSARGR